MKVDRNLEEQINCNSINEYMLFQKHIQDFYIKILNN